MKSIEQIFKEQTNLIQSGICLTNTQFSIIVKPIDYTRVNIPVYLNIKYQLHFSAMPPNVYNAIVDKSRKKSVIVYEFFIQLGKIEPMAFIVSSLNGGMIASGIAKGNFAIQKERILKYCKKKLKEGVKSVSCSC